MHNIQCRKSPALLAITSSFSKNYHDCKASIKLFLLITCKPEINTNIQSVFALFPAKVKNILQLMRAPTLI